MRSVLLDTLADGISAVGVAISGAIILATQSFYWLDPAVALGISMIIGYHAIKLVREVLGVLRTETPQPSTPTDQGPFLG